MDIGALIKFWSFYKWGCSKYSWQVFVLTSVFHFSWKMLRNESSDAYGKYICESENKSKSHSVLSNSLRPGGLYSPRNSLGQNTGVGSLSSLQGIFPIQGSNSGLPHCRQFLYQLSHKGSPKYIYIYICVCVCVCIYISLIGKKKRKTLPNSFPEKLHHFSFPS